MSSSSPERRTVTAVMKTLRLERVVLSVLALGLGEVLRVLHRVSSLEWAEACQWPRHFRPVDGGPW